MVTIYEAFVLKRLTQEEHEKLEENGEVTSVQPLVFGGFFKIDEIRKWATTLWVKLIEEEGIIQASQYIIKVWKNVDNRGGKSVKYLGDLSAFIQFEDDTIDYLFHDCMAYDWDEEGVEGDNGEENENQEGQE